MRHAPKAATEPRVALLLVRPRVSVLTGLLVATLSVPVLAGLLAPTARALDSTGGTPAAAAVTNAPGLGGVVAPSTQGTGGSEYGVTVSKPRSVSKATTRKPSHAARRTHVAPKPKAPAPKPKPKSKPKPKPNPKPVTPAPANQPAGAPTPAQTVAEGALFPVLGIHSFGNAENRFGAAREGHVHEGQDVLASEGLQVVAPLAGTIIATAYQAGGAGWYVAEHSVDGLDFFYAHCQASSLTVTEGEAISAGQAICKVGQTGDATGPHLHLEVWVGGWQTKGGYPIDPLPYLEAWERAVG